MVTIPNKEVELHSSSPLLLRQPHHPAKGYPSKDFVRAKNYSPPFQLSDWEGVRDGHIAPKFLSDLSGSETGREEFLTGARALGLDTAKKRLPSQSLYVADVINATRPDGTALHNDVGILLPRRSTKTTTLIALALGRCLMRDDYLVAFTFATTGSKVRQRFLADVFPILENLFPEGERPFYIRRSAGQEQVVFDNGSRLLVVIPQGMAFRSEAFDMVVVDEAGEADPLMGEDLLSGIVPVFDTRPSGQLIVAGTAATYRTGNLLWDFLEAGRQDKRGSGIVEYSAPDWLTIDDVETWEQTEPIITAAHPGIGTVTTIEVIERNFHRLSRAQFMREYLSIFEDQTGTTGILNAQKWKSAEVQSDSLPTPPDHFVFGIAATTSQSSACIVAAWRENGQARVLVVDQREGVKWLAPRVIELARKYKQAKIVHDSQGVILAEVLQLKQERLKLEAATTKHVTTGAALLVKELHTGNLGHWGQFKTQSGLNVAALVATQRKIGEHGWAFGRGLSLDDDITPLEAASLALRSYDETPKKRAMRLIA